MIQIKRDILLEELYTFFQEGHGVVIGKPGVGKSYMLRLLKKHLAGRKILSFIIKIDHTENATDDAIRTELGLDAGLNWIDTLKKINVKDNKAVLIFDAFDAARDESIRKGYLSQIRKAKRELSDKWNIIVSVRTYDAYKSPDLISIFPQIDSNAEITCRHKVIPVLTRNELDIILVHHETMNVVYRECTEELKKILKTPYFLILLENVLSSASLDQINSIKAIKSETQLLATYWTKKISNTPEHILKEAFLARFTTQLIENRTLNCPKNVVFKTLPSKEELATFNYLMSEDILNEHSINNNRISYSHNILFDYAVSRLCIESSYSDILLFLAKDLSRPFFLRPSFIYFFTQLWYDDRMSFWDTYWKFQGNSQKEIQLFTRLVLDTVIVTEYSSIDDLMQLLKGDKTSVKIVHQFLQSLRFARENNFQSQDIDFLLFLSEHMELEYLWDYSFLLEKAIDNRKDDHELLKKCGAAARNFFNVILSHRSDSPHIDRLGATRGVDLLVRTYKTDPVNNRALLEKIFSFLKEKDFEIWYFSSIAEGLKEIINSDPDFVSTVYNTLFHHVENSDKETNMGNNVVLNFKSNRRQDFDLCLYRLTKFFPEFLTAVPSAALKTGLNIINDLIINDWLYFDADSKTYQFNLNGVSCEFIPDTSYVWGENSGYQRQGQLTQMIFQYFESHLQNVEEQKEIKSLLPVFFANAKVAFLWKTFISLGTKYPKIFTEELFSLALVPQILECNDTIFDIGQAIEQIAFLISKERLKQIEQNILDLRYTSFEQHGYIKLDEEQLKLYKERILSKLLNKVPRDLLQLPESNEFIKEHDVVANKPLVTYTSTSEPVTIETRLKEEKIDIKEPTNSKLIRLIKSVESFNYQWLNSYPLRDDYVEHLESAKNILTELEQAIEIPKTLKEQSLSSIAKTLTIISRNAESLEKEEFEFVKNAILKCFNYISKYDEHFDNTQSPASGYSPTARIEAAEALTNLAIEDSSNTLLDIVKKAANDTNPIVRFNVIKSISKIKKRDSDTYWDLITTRLERETDYFTSSVIINNVIIDKEEAQEIIDKVIVIANNKEGFFDSNNSFTESYAALLLWLYTAKGNPTAKEILDNRLSNFSFCRTIVFKAYEYIYPGNPYNDYVSKPQQNEKLVLYIKKIVEINGTLLSTFKESEFKTENETIKHSLELIDHIIQRTYFALDLNERIRGRNRIPVQENNRKAFYFVIKPILEDVISFSSNITAGGVILAHTAHYFMEILNGVVSYDPKEVLSMAHTITKLSEKTRYTFDSSSIKEVVGLTEKLLADHRDLLLDEEAFTKLIELLDVYINSGWTDALELLWKLNDIFK